MPNQISLDPYKSEPCYSTPWNFHMDLLIISLQLHNLLEQVQLHFYNPYKNPLYYCNKREHQELSQLPYLNPLRRQ